MSLIFEKCIETANVIKQKIKKFSDETKVECGETLVDIEDTIYSSLRFRRAHVSIVDARETKNLWLLHVTIFPHTNDPSPIYGFDIIAGPNKVSGAFHDFSESGDSENFMYKWFQEQTADLDWNKPRELPLWAKQIFSPGMIAIGAVGLEELEKFVDVGLKNLDYYLNNVGIEQQSMFDYHMAQNKYCRYQKENPQTPKVLVAIGFDKQQADNFVQNNLFPEIG